MANYCFDCHDGETKKGEVRLDNLGTLALKDRLDLLNRVQEQIFIKEMPPKKRKLSQAILNGSSYMTG